MQQRARYSTYHASAASYFSEHYLRLRASESAFTLVGGRRYGRRASRARQCRKSWARSSPAYGWIERFLLLLGRTWPLFYSHHRRTHQRLRWLLKLFFWNLSPTPTSCKRPSTDDALLRINRSALGSNRIKCPIELLPSMDWIYGDSEHPMAEIVGVEVEQIYARVVSQVGLFRCLRLAESTRFPLAARIIKLTFHCPA